MTPPRPRGATRTSRLGRAVGATGSLAFLVAWIGGLPVALVAWGHWPITGRPTLDQVRDLPYTITTDAALFGVLTVAVWVVWAAFTISVAVEVVGGLGGRRMTVPMCGPIQRAARALVVSLLMSGSAGSVSAPTAAGALSGTPAVVVVDQHGPTVSQPPPQDLADPTADGAAVVEVRHHDTYWALAERILGDGMRWREIRDLNTGRTMPDGHVLVRDQGELRPGWVLVVPTTPPQERGAGPAAVAGRPRQPATEVVVAPGDSMWRVADAHLSGALGRPATNAEIAPYWQAFIDINRDRLVNPDNPNLIYPGQVFILPPLEAPVAPPAPPGPNDPAAPNPTAPQPTAPPGSDGPAAPSPTTATPAAPQPTAPPTPESPASAPTSTAPQAPASTATPSPTTTTTPSATTATPADSGPPAPPDTGTDAGGDSPRDGDQEAPWLVGITAAGMALAGVLVVLQRRRRAQLRHRKPGERPRPPESRLQAAEAQLHAAAALLDSQLVDLALRVAAASTGGAGLPGLRWVQARAGMVRVAFDEPAEPPRGFRAEAPDRWRLAVAPADLPSLDATPSPPFPTLCPLGATVDGAELLIDLESHGVVTVGGDDHQRRDLLRSVAVAAATAPWASQSRVLLVGMAGKLASLPNVETVAGFGEALDIVEAHTTRVTRALSSIRSASVVQARTSGTTPDAWEPVVLVSAQPPTDLDARRLVALARSAGHATAVVCPDTTGLPIDPVWVIDSGGDLRARGVDGVLRSHRLDEGDLRVVIDLLEDARTTESVPATAPSLPAVRAHPPPPPPAGSDAGLDDLLADVDVVVRVLGDVTVQRRPSGAADAAWPEGWQRVPFDRHRALETLCYLALREGRVAMEDLQAALFPAGTNAPRTFHNAVTGARRAVGDELFPHPQEGCYELSERVVTDYGLFCELAARADETTEPATAMRLLTDALGLVDSEPFVGPGRGFAWVGPHTGMIISQVIDTAEQLAQAAIATDDWRKAEWAARQGLRAFPTDERMYRILMRAAHAAGNIAGVHHAYRELLDALADPDTGVEPEDTVHPETIQLLQQLTGRATA